MQDCLASDRCIKLVRKKDITQTQLKLFPNNLGLTSNLSHYGLNSMKSGRHREK